MYSYRNMHIVVTHIFGINSEQLCRIGFSHHVISSDVVGLTEISLRKNPKLVSFDVKNRIPSFSLCG